MTSAQFGMIMRANNLPRINLSRIWKKLKYFSSNDAFIDFRSKLKFQVKLQRGENKAHQIFFCTFCCFNVLLSRNKLKIDWEFGRYTQTNQYYVEPCYSHDGRTERWKILYQLESLDVPVFYMTFAQTDHLQKYLWLSP